MSVISRICGLKLVINGPTVVLVNFEQRRSWNCDTIFPCIESLVKHSLLFSMRYLYAEPVASTWPLDLSILKGLWWVSMKECSSGSCAIIHEQIRIHYAVAAPQLSPSFHRQLRAVGLKNRNMLAILFFVWHSENFVKMKQGSSEKQATKITYFPPFTVF